MLKYFDASKGDAFYSVYNVSTHTFSGYKVMWRQMTPLITAAVIGPQNDCHLGVVPAVAQHVVSIIATGTADEAHYICAMLNSSVASAISAS
jgi:adenine-specific DNA-methyltransferase